MTAVNVLTARFTGTFRPDRIRSIADRFGVNGDMVLENILYGTLLVHSVILLTTMNIFTQLALSTVNIR